ncbi:4Fe-4S binding protein [Tistrella bauzanensis]|uniref:4Fe-4S dicluster domain-containing protein n=1 Tax=Tistrella TaxID=171436 RepID=UPI0031F712B1
MTATSDHGVSPGIAGTHAPKAAALSRRKRRRHLPQPVRGHFRRLKTRLILGFLAIFFLVPFLRWDRGPGLPDQAVLVDLPGRRLFVFGLEFWPQDLPIAVGLMVAGAFGLFYATSLSGRVWCGFACPQTVWTDIFGGIGRLAHRLARGHQARIRPITLVLSAIVAVATGIGFTAWFVDAPGLAGRLLSGDLPGAAYGTILVIAGFTYVLGAHAQERVCLHMCPWPRFQSALLDRDSLVVTYRAARGEPRARKRVALRPDLLAAAAAATAPMAQVTAFAVAADGRVGLAPDAVAGRGDCVDCGRCVQVCPTGIDIRDGLQMGCIGCGLCIDACDEVMTRIERPTGLIRFDAEQADPAPMAPPARIGLFQPKAMVFGAAMVAALLAVAIGVTRMTAVQIDVEPQNTPRYVLLSDGSVRNDYVVRLSHRLPRLSAVTASVDGMPTAELRFAAGDGADAALMAVSGQRSAANRLLITRPPLRGQPAHAGELHEQPAHAGELHEQPAHAGGPRPVTLVFNDTETGAELARVDTRFWEPEP